MSELPQVHGVVAQRGEHKEQGYAIFFAYQQDIKGVVIKNKKRYEKEKSVKNQ